MDFQMISTPSSFIPRALNTKVNMHVLGKSLNLFEVSKNAAKSLSLGGTRKPQKVIFLETKIKCK